jgi:hypothetical protein
MITFPNYRLLSLMIISQILCMNIHVHAQAAGNTPRFRAGLTFGPVATDVHGTDTRDSDSDFSKLGFSFGLLVNTALSEKNILQFEINYIQKGAQQKPDSANNGYFRLALNYIEVPLVFRRKMHMNIRKKPNDRLDLEGGVSYARLVGYSYNVDNYALVVDSKKLNTGEVSLLAGINYNFTPSISFGFRYSNSITPAIVRNSIPAQFFFYAYNSGNNQVVLFSFRYVLGGKKNKSDNSTPPPPSAG